MDKVKAVKKLTDFDREEIKKLFLRKPDMTLEDKNDLAEALGLTIGQVKARLYVERKIQKKLAEAQAEHEKYVQPEIKDDPELLNYPF